MLLDDVKRLNVITEVTNSLKKRKKEEIRKHNENKIDTEHIYQSIQIEEDMYEEGPKNPR